MHMCSCHLNPYQCRSIAHYCICNNKYNNCSNDSYNNLSMKC